MAEVISHGGFVGPGERLTAEYFRDHLPSAWTVICNKELLFGDGPPREVDFIIVADHAVFIVEEKHWWGEIKGNENSWVLSGSMSLPSPLTSVGKLAKRFAGLVQDEIPELKQRRVQFCSGMVVISHPNARLFIDDPRAAAQVFKLAGCEEQFLEADKRQQKVCTLTPFHETIVTLLTAGPDRPEVPREIGPYEILEALETIGPVRAYRARHRDGSERLLKLAERPTLSTDQKREEAFLLREYNALKRLAQTGRAAAVDPYFDWSDSQYWVTPIHYPQGATLRACRMTSDSCVERALEVSADAFEALAAVHDAGVIHRALSPDRIWLADGEDRVMFSDFLMARIDEELSVAQYVGGLPLEPYFAPECARSPATATVLSDVYGLALSLTTWITGIEPGSDGRRPDRDDVVADLADALGPHAAAMLIKCLEEEPGRRPQLDEVRQKLSTALAAKRSAESGLAVNELAPGTLIDERHRIIRRLGTGGTADTYLVEDEYSDHMAFVLKLIRDPELATRLGKTEFASLVRLKHRCLPQVYDVQPAGSPYNLKLEYIEGLPLGVVSPQYRGDLTFFLRVARDVLDALEYLEEHGQIHRDVSPANILVPDEETEPIRLIDFGLATGVSDTTTAVGTPRYRAPEIDHGGAWTSSCDIYSLAVILFQLLTGRLPFQLDEGIAKKALLVAPTEAEKSEFGAQLLDVLLWAASPDVGERCPDATTFWNDLRQAALAVGVPEPDGEPLVNSFVAGLRRLYRNSRLGNGDNRGLDSQFALDTYVPTDLDTELIPRLLAGEHRLVILSGNPGDGKTAFLCQLKSALEENGAQCEHTDEAGWRFRIGEQVFSALYDASESHGDASADDLLVDVLRPLTEAGGSTYTAAVAANDGRLISFFEEHPAEYRDLWQTVEPQLLGADGAQDGVLVIDLKKRALVGLDPSAHSLASRILGSLTDPSRWATCDRCSARHACPIVFNARSFSNVTGDSSTWLALHRLLLATHLRRERRVTVRDLRSALSYLITHDLSCEEVHQEIGDGRSPSADVSRLYFCAAFEGTSGDELLDTWQALDPGEVPSPDLERHLHFHRHVDQLGKVRELMIDLPDRREPPGEPGGDGSERVSYLKRRFFFEGDASHVSELDLPLPVELLPYRYLQAFIEGLQEPAAQELLTSVLRGISRADGAPPGERGSHLSLTASESSDTGVSVIKRFVREDFSVASDSADRRYVQCVPDRLQLQHRGGSARLDIGLDLFEYVSRTADGQLPGAQEQGALLEDLRSFKGRLLAYPSTEVVLVEGSQRARVVRSEGTKIVLGEAHQWT